MSNCLAGRPWLAVFRENNRMEEASRFSEPELPAVELDGEGTATERLTPALDRIYEQIERVQVELPRTEEVLHKVVEAAEHNQAIEKIFELRHEAKDISAPANSRTAFSVGTVLQQQAHPALNTAPLSQSSKPLRGIVAILPPKNSLYGQAVRYGFVTALLTLALSTVLVLWFT